MKRLAMMTTILVAIIFLQVVTMTEPVHAPKPDKWILLHEDSVSSSGTPVGWYSYELKRDFDIGGETMGVYLRFTISNLVCEGIGNTYVLIEGKDRFGNFTQDAIQLATNGTFISNELFFDVDLFYFYDTMYAEFSLVFVFEQQDPERMAEGVKPSPPWWQPKLEWVKDMIQNKIRSPVWNLWTQFIVTVEGVLSTVLLVGLSYLCYKLVLHPLFFKRKWKIKKVIVEDVW